MHNPLKVDLFILYSPFQSPVLNVTFPEAIRDARVSEYGILCLVNFLVR